VQIEHFRRADPAYAAGVVAALAALGQKVETADADVEAAVK